MMQFAWLLYLFVSGSLTNAQPCPPANHTLLPYLNTESFDSSALSFHLCDPSILRQCYSNLSIAFLGDSVLSERVNDLVLVLSEANKSVIDKFSTHHSHGNVKHVLRGFEGPGVGANGELLQSQISFDGDPFDFKIDYCPNHRNFSFHSIKVPISARFQFVGHHQWHSNGGGVITLLHKDIEAELHRVLVDSKPNTVVMNIGHHDVGGTDFAIANFHRYIVHFLVKWNLKLVSSKDSAQPVFLWLSHLHVNTESKPQKMAGIIAIDRLMNRLMPLFQHSYFVNCSHVHRAVTDFSKNPQKYTWDNTHFGSIGRFYHPDQSGIISMLSTLCLSSNICQLRQGLLNNGSHTPKFNTPELSLLIRIFEQYRGFVHWNDGESSRVFVENGFQINANESVINDLYRQSDVSNALFVPKHLLEIVPVGPPLPPNLRSHILVRIYREKLVYYLCCGYRYSIASGAVMVQFGFDWGQIQSFPESVIGHFPIKGDLHKEYADGNLQLPHMKPATKAPKRSKPIAS